MLQKGADYGWPECYYDQLQKKLVLAPEYGGDGGKKVGVCAEKQAPVAAFPGHWAPNDLLIYTGNAVPAAYQGGAFVAFHGSWNRAPEPQGGYNVVFQPLADGKAAGHFRRLRRRLCRRGQRAGPGGVPADRARHGTRRRALYFRRHARPHLARHLSTALPMRRIAPAPAPKVAGRELRRTRPARGHPSRRRPHDRPRCRFPPGATKNRSRLGDRIFHGEAAGGTCTGCHGSDAHGGRRRHRRWSTATG